MGAVYVAEQLSTGRKRALKLMHPSLVSDAKLRERFEQEARVGAKIPSDHVVQVIAAGVDEATGAPFIAMEMLEGEDLAATLARQGALRPEDVRAILEPVCHALSAAHVAGIVHRDLKPENIFLLHTRGANRSFDVKLLDFGIAKLTADARTMATSAVGTPLWMAPEQTDPRARVMPSADVWSLGLLVFTALTGRSYWRAAAEQGVSVQALMREILFEPLAPASVRAVELGVSAPLPAELDKWFARCLDRKPDARFATANEAWTALVPTLGSVLAPPTELAALAGLGSGGVGTGLSGAEMAATMVAPGTANVTDLSVGKTVPVPAPAQAQTGLTSARPSRLPWVIAGGAIAAALAIVSMQAFGGKKSNAGDPDSTRPIAQRAMQDVKDLDEQTRRSAQGDPTVALGSPAREPETAALPSAKAEPSAAVVKVPHPKASVAAAEPKNTPPHFNAWIAQKNAEFFTLGVKNACDLMVGPRHFGLTLELSPDGRPKKVLGPANGEMSVNCAQSYMRGFSAGPYDPADGPQFVSVTIDLE